LETSSEFKDATVKAIKVKGNSMLMFIIIKVNGPFLGGLL
jgi:hypothetical protein